MFEVSHNKAALNIPDLWDNLLGRITRSIGLKADHKSSKARTVTWPSSLYSRMSFTFFKELFLYCGFLDMQIEKAQLDNSVSDVL